MGMGMGEGVTFMFGWQFICSRKVSFHDFVWATTGVVKVHLLQKKHPSKVGRLSSLPFSLQTTESEKFDFWAGRHSIATDTQRVLHCQQFCIKAKDKLHKKQLRTCLHKMIVSCVQLAQLCILTKSSNKIYRKGGEKIRAVPVFFPQMRRNLITG